MRKYLFTILLKTFVISLIITVFLLTILLIIQPVDNANLHFNATGMIYGVSIIIILCLTLLSTTIFLNTINKIRENTFQSFLTFTFLPINASVILTIFSLPVSDFPFWISCAITLPYLATIGYHFFNFRRNFHQII